MYSLVAAGGALTALGIGGVIMVVVGLIVLVHGIVLLTPLSAGIARVSGPLMILWALVMLGNQVLLGAQPGWGMGASMSGSGMGGMMASGVGWDPGMVAIAVLMLASGLIMSRQRSTGGM